MFHIVADSGCDIFTLQGASFSTVPLVINTDTTSYVDDENLNTASMIEELLVYKGRSFTACPSIDAWMNAFVPATGEIPEELYVVTLTSGLSGTYNSACVALEAFLEKHPGVKGRIFDSLSVGPEMRLMLEKIVELKMSGQTFDEVCAAMDAYQSKHRLFFAFKSLHNLAQNGRVSKIVASAAGALGISVYGTASEVGHIESLGKARGDRKVIAGLLKEMEKAGYRGGKVRITQTENEALAQLLMNTIREKYSTTDIEYYKVRGLCSYYCERGGICISCEVE